MQKFMRAALEEAKKAAQEEEVPIGAVVVLNGAIIGRGYNQMEQKRDATAHAEVLALREAAASIGNWRLNGCHLYVTLEPCLMCLGAVLNTRVDRLVIGAADPKEGALAFMQSSGGRRKLEGLEIYEGILEDDCSRILTKFFQEKRL